MPERLAGEILDGASNTGSSVKKKKIYIKWLSQIRRLLIIGGSKGLYLVIMWRINKVVSEVI